MLKNFNFSFSRYKIKLTKIIKIMNIIQIDFFIARDLIKNLFKTNINKKQKKPTNNYLFAFERVLIEIKTIYHRENKIEKLKIIAHKKTNN